jgi:hypothetical protein
MLKFQVFVEEFIFRKIRQTTKKSITAMAVIPVRDVQTTGVRYVLHSIAATARIQR